MKLLLEQVSSNTRHGLSSPGELYTLTLAVTSRSHAGMLAIRLMIPDSSAETCGVASYACELLACAISPDSVVCCNDSDKCRHVWRFLWHIFHVKLDVHCRTL